MTNERRLNPRIPLDNMMYVAVNTNGRELTCVLLDISITGARLGVPPDTVLPPQASKLDIQASPPLETLLANTNATVMWCFGVQFGVRFENNLSIPLEEISVLLNSAIFY